MVATMSGHQHNCRFSFKPPSGPYGLVHGTYDIYIQVLNVCIDVYKRSKSSAYIITIRIFQIMPQ